MELGSGMDGIVDALTVSGSDLYAGGAFTIAGNGPANHVAKWNGGSWSSVGSGIGGVAGVLVVIWGAVFDGGGGFPNAGGDAACQDCKWEWGSWVPVGFGVEG